MMQSIAVGGRRIVQTQPWIAVAALLALCLLAYYALLGFRYIEAAKSIPSLTSEVDQLSSETAAVLPQRAPAVSVEAAQKRQEETRKIFTYPNTDGLMAVMSATAQETGVSLLSMAVGEPLTKIEGGIAYQGQPMTLLLQGKPADAYRFLAALQQRVPVVEVTNVGLSADLNPPAAQVQLLYYLAPQAVAAGKGAK